MNNKGDILHISKQYRNIMAKYDNNEGLWLPLWMHLKDTAEIMKKLVDKWVSDSIIEACGLEREMFCKIAMFLAACHDCGKATSYFQSIITINCNEMFNKLNDNKLLVRKKESYRSAGKTPHAYAGQCILQSGLAGIELDESLACVVGAHHGRPIDRQGIYEGDLLESYPANFYGKEHDKEQKERWSNIWKEIMDDALMISGIENVQILPKINTNAQVLLSGLLIVADWLASNTEFFPLISLEENLVENIYPLRIDIGWEKCRFPEGWISEINMMDEDIFAERFHFLPNEIQRAVLEAVNHCSEPGIFILEAQMGCGKTEAALSAAEVIANKVNCSGIFFALPTQATSNGIYHRLYDWAEYVSEETRNAIRLAHSGAEYNEEYQKQVISGKAFVDDVDNTYNELMVHPWFQGNKKALLSDFVIGTVDQFLMGALKKRHFMLRHIGLAGKVIVIDECHSYDAYMNSYLDRMLEWMASYKIPVILLSATLPVKRRNELISIYAKTKGVAEWKQEKGYPLLTWTDGKTVKNKVIPQNGEDKKVNLKIIDGKKSLLSILEEKLTDGGCACIITNTVKSAQQYYDMIESNMNDVKLILYHSQYLMPDRIVKEQELLAKMGKESSDKERERLILIGTQVLEQSLDYDADIMFTELCPVDLFIQRIGRLHRHNRNKDRNGFSRPEKLKSSECYILMDELNEEDYTYDAGSKKIYGDYLLTRTRKILPDVLNIPVDIPKLVQAVYDEDNDLGLAGTPGYSEMCEEYFRVRGNKKSNAKQYLLKKPIMGIRGILSNEDKSADSSGEQRVRDAGTTIEIILMREEDSEKVCFLDQKKYGDEKILKSSMPEDELAQRILRQRIRLPQIFSTEWMIEKTIDELEKRQDMVAVWQKSPWLSGELILLLDKNNETSLNGYKLCYDFSKGLTCDKQEETNEG